MSDLGEHCRKDTWRQLTTSLAFVVAGVVVVLGVAFVFLPDILIASRRYYLVNFAGLLGEAAFRGGSGLVLMLAARASRLPREICAIGAVVLLVGLATPLLGIAAAQSRLDWEAAHITFLRVEGTLIVCLGVIIASAFLPRRPIASPLGTGREVKPVDMGK